METKLRKATWYCGHFYDILQLRRHELCQQPGSFTLLPSEQARALAPRMEVTSSEEAVAFTQGLCNIISFCVFGAIED
ncbi:hypothetical protein STEG23_003915 [Scotinomys teguina]